MSKTVPCDHEPGPPSSGRRNSLIFAGVPTVHLPAYSNERHSLPPLQQLPRLPSSREAQSMPLIESESRLVQSFKKNDVLPSAVNEDAKQKTAPLSSPASTPSLSRMRSELSVQVEAYAQGGQSQASDSATGGELQPLVNEQSPFNGNGTSQNDEGTSSSTARKDGELEHSLTTRDIARSNTVHSSCVFRASPMNGLDSPSLTPKLQTPRLGDLNPSYTRSLVRLLTPSILSATSSPRIHPVTYIAPDAASEDDDGKSAGVENLGTDGHHEDPQLQTNKRLTQENNGFATVKHDAELPTQMVQVATALAVIDHPPSSLDGAQRLVYLKTQAVIDGIFGKPTESLYAKLLNRIMFVCIVLNFMMMAAETCEGQNFPGSDPGYPYLPDETTYEILDAVFSIVFTIELFGRVAAKKFQKAIIMDPFTLIDFLALCPWFAQLILAIGGVEFSVSNLNGSGHAIVLLRLLRAARLGNILRHFDQSRILYLSIRASLRPLGITMFFLFTLVMLLATALFYAEPCYNVNTCAFTDIFNSAYFIMVTIATVGYGNQVPSLNNWASLMIACVAMLFGQMYFALPVFIVGTNFENTYDNFQWDNKRKKRQRDETLSPFDAQTMHSFTHHLTNTHFQLLSAWRVVQISIQKMLLRSKQDEKDTMQAALAQSILLTKIKEAIEKLLVAHGESCGLLQTFVPHKKKSESVNAEVRTEGVLSHMYVRARRAMAKKRVEAKDAGGTIRNSYMLSETLRGRLWLALEVPDSSKLASVINIFMVSSTLLSVLLFCCESLPELSTTGVETLACKRVVQDYCTNTGFYAATTWELPDEGCFVRNANGTTDFSRQILFTCADVLDDPACYGNGLNFGSLDPTAFDCANSFTATGVNVICYRRQCNRIDTIVDMGPYWIYFEWTFGLGFTLELALRFVASQDRGRLIRDFYTIFDILAVVPFFVEVVQYVVQGVEPTYAIVATSPSLLSVIRVLKTMRILKLTRHFKGTKVLVSTARSVWKQLTIPVFFLIAGCTIAGAVFYEIERGTECFVGTECWWWDKNVLTPALSQGLPDGKRVLIQDRRFVILPDMKYSTWLAYSTLTAVGYGDLVPRTSIGKVFCICVVIISTIYSAMPVSLVGSKFYSLYEKHMEKMVVKRGGSSSSWRTSKRKINPTSSLGKSEPMSARNVELFGLTDKDLEALHQFVTMRRTLMNLQRSLDNFNSVGIDIMQQRKSSYVSERGGSTRNIRKTDNIEQSIEQKCNAITDTLLQFSLVMEKLQDAPPGFEALVDDPVQALVAGTVLSRKKFS